MNYTKGAMAVALAILVAGLPSSALGATDEIADGQWYVSALGLAEAHGIGNGVGAKLALIDSGVDATHPDLRGSILAGADFAADRNDKGLKDPEGHGTSLAGLIAGHGRVSGVAPGATIISISNGYGGPGGFSENGDAQGIEWAIVHGINIICIASSAAPDARLAAAIDKAIKADVVIVAAAGNRSRDAGVSYPASAPGVLAIGGTAKNGRHSSASVSGADVALVAPADSISVAYRNHGYAVTTGTSNSSAIVAGAVALIRGKYPQLSAQQVISALTSTAVDEGQPGRDFDYGYGRIDIVAALKKAGTMQPEPSAKPSATFPTSTTATVTATSPEPKSGPSTAVLAAIIIGGLLAAAVIVVLVVGLSRRT